MLIRIVAEKIAAAAFFISLTYCSIVPEVAFALLVLVSLGGLFLWRFYALDFGFNSMNIRCRSFYVCCFVNKRHPCRRQSSADRSACAQGAFPYMFCYCEYCNLCHIGFLSGRVLPIKYKKGNFSSAQL